MDPIQIVIIFSLLVITTVVVVLAVQFHSLLKEIKSTVSKTSLILDDAKLITASVATPVSSFSEFVMGFKSGLNIFNKIFKKESQE